MLNLITCCASAFVLSLLFTPIAKKVAQIFKIVDKPGHRKIHDRPIPFLGGVAVYFAFVLSMLAFTNHAWEGVGVALVGAAFIFFGLLDDSGILMRARYKISAHLIFALVLIFGFGVQFNLSEYNWLNWLVTAGFITFMTNSMNMLDGMDGLDSGVAAIAATFFAILAFKGAEQNSLIVALSLIGACLGFLVYNFNPASIFLGEAGSTFLGFVLAILAIKINLFYLAPVAFQLGVERVQVVSFIIPLIILGVPIFDTYFVFANRYLNHIKFSQPGKDHSHHRIHLMGFSQKATVLSIYMIAMVLGLIALAMVNSGVLQFFALLAVVGLFFVGFSVFLLQAKVYE